VNCAQVGIFKEGDQISLHGLLKSTDGGCLKTQIGLDVLSDFANKTLKGKLSNEKLTRFLIATDLTKGNGSF
jgi:hypothetical protein